MEITDLIGAYKDLGIEGTIDRDKFSAISVVHHSTVLEGSTLTELEATILITDGLTPGGKPLIHSLMVSDHYEALMFVMREAEKKTPVTVRLLQEIAGLVLRQTGTVYRTVLGDVDSRNGEFRRGNVFAGDTYFPNYDKVEGLTTELIRSINIKMGEDLSMVEKLNLSFDAHFNLVSIHPFYDGNGRTSRLLMNYIQRYYGLPLAVVRWESKREYIEALIEAREKKDVCIFRDFMGRQYAMQPGKEIEMYKNLISND